MSKLKEIRDGIFTLMNAMTAANGYQYSYTVKGDNLSLDGEEGDIARFNYDQFPLIELLTSEDVNRNDGYDMQVASDYGFMPYDMTWQIRGYFQNTNTNWFDVYDKFWSDLNKLVGEHCDISHNADQWYIDNCRPENNQLGSNYKIYISDVRITFQQEI